MFEYQLTSIPKAEFSGVKTLVGSDEVLLEQEDNLLANASFNAKGWEIQLLLQPADFQRLHSGIFSLIRLALAAEGTEISDSLPLEKYHDWVDDQLHEKIVGRISNLPIGLLPISMAILPERIGAMLQTSVSTLNPSTGLNIFHVRIIRPGKSDFNPIHKDVWLPRLKNAANLYLPLCGSNQHSSLPVISGSQWWSEAEIERTESGFMGFTVPTALSCKTQPIIERPDVPDGYGLVFSPYLLHGGAENANKDLTRISLEMRFFRK